MPAKRKKRSRIGGRGVRVRRARAGDAPAIARAHVDSWRTTYSGILPASSLEEQGLELRTGQWKRHLAQPEPGVFVYVVEESGEIAGFAVAGPEKTEHRGFQGELYAIYLRKEAQGRGLGRRLVSAVARRFRREGIHSMIVWVLTANPARGFYEALGGRLAGEGYVEFGGTKLPAVAYGWDDLRPASRAGGPHS